MSSKFLELAWEFKTVTVEEKLFLIAVADISDRNGMFTTTYSELSAMMSVSTSMVTNCFHKLSQRGGPVKIQVSHNEGNISGQLMLQRQNTNEGLNQETRQNLHAMAQRQHENMQYAQPKSKAKLNRSQFAQQRPLTPAKNEKMINIIEITPNEIPNWAETTMYSKGVLGRKDIWLSFVEDVQGTGEKLFPQSMLVDRLTQKIYHFKNDALNKPHAGRPVVKQSSRDEYAEKVSNLYQDMKCDWDE
ncbi:hypothetical protein L3Q72_13905 [Vibrio sp. JC009]|uniref:hypothetical protein n=1 Tax=Vibrio sp. JC009 TaxID=2912314 RepID=UPI0023B0021C|nr:hypothetical protein [Vibrio sp. JC009]WED21688.1 hypothetical protein L3Q72_13905 [Vibrio sp. JC009]